SIGDADVAEACRNLTTLALKHANMAVPWHPEFRPTLNMLFTQETIERAERAHGVVVPRYEQETYENIAPAVTLGVEFNDSGVPTIDEARLEVQMPAASRLLHTIDEIRGIYLKYEKVKYVLRWMNRNATPGAIRHYWPTALNLCKQSTALQELAGGTTRYAEPPGIGDHLQMLRDTAATVAAAALMPDTLISRPRERFWLTFHSIPNIRDDGTSIRAAETD